MPCTRYSLIPVESMLHLHAVMSFCANGCCQVQASL